MEARRIGFIGGGNMATALIAGLRGKAAVAADLVQASDVNHTALQALQQQFQIATLTDNVPLVQWADCLVLAVKPQSVASALAAVRPYLGKDKLLISVCAGVTLSTLQQLCGEQTRLIRAMPNTPALVGEGATALALGPNASDADLAFASDVFSLVGRCWTVAESLLDAVTGLSGSGPAYVMLFIEALADGGVRAGLPRDIAQQLATQTVLGSARLVADTGVHPAQLKDRVTSPAGTTVEGLCALERGAFRSSVIEAVFAAAQRSAQLGMKTK